MDASDWDARYADTALMWSAGPNVFVEQTLSSVTPGLALDVAAGEGRNAIWLAEQGWSVTAADFSEVAVERMREIAGARLGEHAGSLRAVVSDATGPAPRPEDADGYDLVLFSYLQLPREAWARAVAAGVAATAVGGLVLVVLHAVRNLEEGVGGPQDAAVLHDPEDVLASVADLPVDVEVAQLRHREVEGAPGPALDTVVLLRRRAD